MPALPFPLPPPPGQTLPPIWDGTEFAIGEARHRVLAYGATNSGWTDGLTAFHEEAAGDSHYIDVASRREALDSLRRHLHSPQPVIMDVGCSSGFLLPELKRHFPSSTVIGADYVYGPLDRLSTRLPGIPLLQFDLTECPLPNACVDAVVLLNVLEHIEDDLRAMQQVQRVLKPGGIAVIEVPAGPQLYDLYDKQLMHHRRYSMIELQRKLKQAGLRTVDRSHLGFFLYPGFWIAKRIGQIRRNAGDQRQKRIVERRIKTGRSSALLGAIMSFESALRRTIYYPFGIRCLVTCTTGPRG